MQPDHVGDASNLLEFGAVHQFHARAFQNQRPGGMRLHALPHPLLDHLHPTETQVTGQGQNQGPVDRNDGDTVSIRIVHRR